MYSITRSKCHKLSRAYRYWWQLSEASASDCSYSLSHTALPPSTFVLKLSPYILSTTAVIGYLQSTANSFTLLPCARAKLSTLSSTLMSSQQLAAYSIELISMQSTSMFSTLPFSRLKLSKMSIISPTFLSFSPSQPTNIKLLSACMSSSSLPPCSFAESPAPSCPLSKYFEPFNWKTNENHIKKILNEFNQFLPQICHHCTKNWSALNLPKSINTELSRYFSTCVEYSSLGGKLTRALLVIYAAAAVSQSFDLPLLEKISLVKSSSLKQPLSSLPNASISSLEITSPSQQSYPSLSKSPLSSCTFSSFPSSFTRTSSLSASVSSTSTPKPPSTFLPSSPSSISPLSSSTDIPTDLFALGWAVELLQASFLVADDLMDESNHRRGKRCWYKNLQNPLHAVNDAFFLYSLPFKVVTFFFENDRRHELMQKILQENATNTILGQHLDSTLLFTYDIPSLSSPSSTLDSSSSSLHSSSPSSLSPIPSLSLSRSTSSSTVSLELKNRILFHEKERPHEQNVSSYWGVHNGKIWGAKDRPDFEEKMVDRQRSIARLKTSYYSFYLPTAFGMIYGGIVDRNLLDHAKNICVEIGEYFQAQDDYLDVFGDASIMGKVGTDIEKGKCSWPLVQAIKYASDEDLQQILENYGKSDKNDIVKKIFQDSGIPQLYENYEKETYEKISGLISGFPHEGLKSVFKLILNRIHRRKM